ncbi:hypothetical protein ABT297_21065 [Dactylosporangium sp. NPDC000555]|uniref:hypothetical protein n=1 Tax=Dactylosporangium sp. NPDC000555 TaxID=3154260 RepID=UPI00333054FB
MIRLLRVPLVLGFAALWALGSYALGFRLLSDNMSMALGTAFVGGVFTAVGLGSLTRRVPLVVLGIPIAIAALYSVVYVAGVDSIDSHPRFALTIASERCVAPYTRYEKNRKYSGCDRHKYTFTDQSGKPVSYDLDVTSEQAGGYKPGEVVEVYERAPGKINFYPESTVEQIAVVRKVAYIAVPVLVVYTVLLGIIGAITNAVRRRVRPEVTDRFS